MSQLPPVSEQTLARLFGVDRRTVSRWVRAGLSAEKQGRVLSIDVAVAIRWVRDRDAEAAEERIATIRATPALDVARTRKVSAEARIAEANAAAREGELLPAVAVGERWTARILAARERLLVVPSVAVQSGVVAADREQDLGRLVHEALTELAES
jgi:phage terminase Nu1 subunit (DNA packaging protein)